jgi:hypothetical protein
MPEPTQPVKKTPPNKASNNANSNNSWVMYALFAALLILGAVNVVMSSMVQNIRYPDLIQLIENTQYQKDNPNALVEGFPGKTTILSGTSSTTKLEVSKLR